MEPTKPLVSLATLEDLKRVLFTQKVIAQECRREMMALATDKELATGKVSGPEEARRLIAGQADLLGKYASYPTLTEFALQPNLAGASKWGATFGVAIMAKVLVIDPAKSAMPAFAKLIRPAYLLTLKELDNPTHQYLIEPLEDVFRMVVTSEDGDAVDEKEGKTLTRRILYKIVEGLLSISAQYGIVEGGGGAFRVTDMGRRVMLHLMDSQRFLEELLVANKRFQIERPDFRMM